MRAAVLALLLAGCTIEGFIPDNDAWVEWKPAWIEFGDAQPNLVAPVSVPQSKSFDVTFTTFDGGCDEFIGMGVDTSDDQVQIYPFNLETHGHKCALILNHVPHIVTVKFDDAGEKVIQLHGLRPVGLSGHVEEEFAHSVTVHVE